MEPAANIGRRNSRKSSRNSRGQSINISDLFLSENSLDFRPHFFNGVKIRAIGRKIQERASGPFYQGTNLCHVMRPQIIHNNDVTRQQVRQQGIGQILDEFLAGSSSAIGDRNRTAIQLDRGKDRCGRWRV